MGGHYTTSDFKDALLFTSNQRRPILNALFRGAITGAVPALFAREWFNPALTAIVSTLFGAMGFLSGIQASRAKLKVTNNEFQMTGAYGPDSRNFRTVNSADLLGFTYLKYSYEGAETSAYPGGLYALVDRSYVCLLPYVDDQQVYEIVDRIRSRFAHMSRLAVHEK